MQKRKIVLFLVLIILLLTVYLFRHPLFYRFQISRLSSLECKEGSCFSRIWAHGVNSIERYQALKKNFSGFELDVIYTGPKGFAVLHPPTEVGAADTLRLDTFLQQADHKNFFWLDTRFLDSVNIWHGGIEALNTLEEKYGILKQHCILEIYDLYIAETLAGLDYTVSFNVSEKWLQDLPRNQSLLDSVNRVLHRVRYVSQEATYLPIVKKLFPNKRILTWHLAIKDFIDRRPIKTLLDDPQVDRILVNIKSP
jgi:hypothetical protein